VDRVDPSVKRERLSSSPRVAHDRCLTDVDDLLDDVQFAEPIVPLGLAAALIEVRLMGALYFLHVTEPVVDESQLVVAQRRQHAAAAVMTADDDVRHAEHIHCELDRRQAIQVGVHDEVRNVAVHEHFAGQEPDDLVGRHAAVGAANP